MIDAGPSPGTLVDQAAAAFADYQAGNRAAFDELVALVTPLLWHTVRSQGVDQTTAEDVIQSAWMGLIRSADRVRDAQTVVKWLLTTTRREAWRVVRRSRDDLRKTTAIFDSDGKEALVLPVQREELPDEMVIRDADARVIWQHIEELPERCRTLLRVIAFADKPDYARIAEALGMPVGSIGPTRGRCLAKLREELSKDPEWGKDLTVGGAS